MAQGKLPNPHLIETDAGFEKAINELRAQPRIAVDTESNSLFAYKEQVCMIQISVPQTDYLLDTLQDIDLEPLGSIIGNNKIEKIFHAAEYDILCLKRDFGFEINNIFDTRVAMRTLGRERTGLGNVLEEEFGVKVNKKWQRADWGQRPLPPELLNYARLDTHYLLPLRDRLATSLHAEGRWDEAKEEWLRLSMYQPNENIFDPDRFWKINGARRLKPQRTAVLREIYLFREEHAKQQNRPPFKVIGDKTLLEIALDNPTSLEDLGNLPGMTTRQIRRYGSGLLTAIDRGQLATPPTRPPTERLREPVATRYKKLRTWRKAKAEGRRVDSDVILSRDIVWEIAHAGPQNLHELHQLMKPMEWRFRNYGVEILELLKPK